MSAAHLPARLAFTLLLLGLAASPQLMAQAPQANARTLRCADVQPENYPTVQAIRFLSERLEKRSGGGLRIQVFHSGLLGDEGALLPLVQSGQLDMNRVSAQALDGISPLTRVLSLPYLFRDAKHQHKVLDGALGQEILDSLERNGLIGLAFYDAGVRSIYTSKKPVSKLEDMKGLEVRVQPSDLAMAVFERLGARPVKLPYSQTGNALSNGLVQSAENNLLSYASTEHYKYAPFYTFSRHTMTPELLLVSKSSWDKLSAQEQAILRRAANESVRMMRELWQLREERVLATLKQAGVKFSELPQEQQARFAEALQPLYTEFTGSPEQQNLIQRIRAIK